MAGSSIPGDQASPLLSAAEYALFEQVGRPCLFASGESLFRRGDLGTTMYVVVQGGIELDFGDELMPRRLGRHAVVGMLGLLVGDHARSADATAIGSTVLLELRPGDFDLLAERNPAQLAHFLRRAIAQFVLNERDLIARLRHRNLGLQSAFDTRQ